MDPVKEVVIDNDKNTLNVITKQTYAIGNYSESIRHIIRNIIMNINKLEECDPSHLALIPNNIDETCRMYSQSDEYISDYINEQPYLDITSLNSKKSEIYSYDNILSSAIYFFDYDHNEDVYLSTEDYEVCVSERVVVKIPNYGTLISVDGMKTWLNTKENDYVEDDNFKRKMIMDLQDINGEEQDVG